jgi:iron complex outermembrane recepter protein
MKTGGEMRTLHRPAAIGSALVLFTQMANAQAPATQNSNEGGLETVTVTATKQAEAVDVNKVPVSISAYGQREMDTRGVKDIGDIAAITPGLIFSQQNNFGTPQTNIEIRGIQSRTSAPTTGIYLDDTPMVGRANNVNTGMNGGYPQVFDPDRKARCSAPAPRAEPCVSSRDSPV